MRIMRAMDDAKPITNIRVKVFGCPTQAAFADLIGVTQPTVSRWENGVEPDRAAMARIRDAAIERGVEWDDRLFFEVPQGSAA
jgi:transcriptional regulator with XRE-family HTH domain